MSNYIRDTSEGPMSRPPLPLLMGQEDPSNLRPRYMHGGAVGRPFTGPYQDNSLLSQQYQQNTGYRPPCFPQGSDMMMRPLMMMYPARAPINSTWGSFNNGGNTISSSSSTVPPPLIPQIPTSTRPPPNIIIDPKLNLPEILELKNDTEWISTWSASKKEAPIRDKQPGKKTKYPTIWEGKKYISQMFEMLKMLKETIEFVKNSEENENETIPDIIDKAVMLKERIEDSEKQFQHSGMYSLLCEKMKRIHNRRRRLKQKRKEIYTAKQQEEEEKATRSKIIDDWQQMLITKNQEKQKEIEFKKIVDSTLQDVRRKISDARNLSNLTKLMKKLRSIRNQTAQQRGYLMPVKDGEIFNSKIDKLDSLINIQMKVYEQENNMLTMMVEEEHSEKVRINKETIHKKETERIRFIQSKAELVLFGPSKPIPPSDPMYEYWKFYNHSISDVGAFIHTRRVWDSYIITPTTPSEIVPTMNNSIPQGWVIPIQSTSDTWQSTLKNYNQQNG